ncbi:UNVERIFIED_CONTAM: hypothetical protein FKN15_059553 [Acipenser sinensis]
MEDLNQISSTTPSADDLRKLTQEYMEESSDLLENNEAEASWGVEDILDLTGGAADALLRHQSPSRPRPADPVNQSVTPISFSNPEPFAMPEETPTASTGKPTETEQQLFAMAEETPTASTGKPTETEQQLFAMAEETPTASTGKPTETEQQLFAMAEETPTASTGKPTETEQQLFAMPEETPTASTGKPTETEQHQGEKKQTKEIATAVVEDKPEAPKPGSSAKVPSSLVSSSGFSMVDLLYWRDIKKTGAVFGASLFFLLSLTVCSIVSVFSYLTLALLSVSITFRIYKGILQAIQKSDEGHPFKAYLDSDVAVSEEVVHKYSDVALGHINCALKELRHLFLVEDLVDSLKAQIDHYLSLVNNQVKDIVAKIQAKVPGLKRKTE